MNLIRKRKSLRRCEVSKFKLKDKVAIVTGGAGGIGTAISMEYARAGAKVVITSRNQENMDKVVAGIKAIGGEALAVVTDVTIPAQVDNMVKQTIDTFGRVDILVNCAGGGSKMRAPTDVPFEEWNSVVTLNLTGTYLCCIAAGKEMIKQESGRIINISSTAGTKGNPGMLHYSAAKAGVISLTNNLAFLWAKHNINVNTILPGFIATPMMHKYKVVPPSTNPDGSPVPRLDLPPDPEHVADLALFLAAPASELISGEHIPIRGWNKSERFWQ